MNFDYAAYERLLAQTQLVLFMIGMGATLNLGSFVLIARRPRSFLAGVIGQFVVVPPVAVLLNRLFDLDAGTSVGLVLVAAMPGGGLSKLFAWLGKGNIPLSISLTVFTTLTSLVTVPLLLILYASAYVPPDFSMPAGEIVLDVALYLLLPLAVGMVLGRCLVRHRVALSRWCIRLGLVVVVVMVAGSLGSGRIRPTAYGWKVPLAIICFCVLGMQIVQIPFYLFRWPRADRMAVGIEATMRNINLALLLYSLFFSRDANLGPGVLFVTLFYAAVAFFAAWPLALRHRRLARRENRDDELTPAAGAASFPLHSTGGGTAVPPPAGPPGRPAAIPPDPGSPPFPAEAADPREAAPGPGPAAAPPAPPEPDR